MTMKVVLAEHSRLRDPPVSPHAMTKLDGGQELTTGGTMTARGRRATGGTATVTGSTTTAMEQILRRIDHANAHIKQATGKLSKIKVIEGKGKKTGREKAVKKGGWSEHVSIEEP